MRRKILLITLIIGLCQTFFPSFAFAKKAKIITPQSEYKYQQKLLRQEEIEKYERGLLPQSGYMTREEYENLSKDVSNEDRVIPEYKLPKDIKMKYIPQPTYKMVRYNDPPGSPELHIERRFKFDKQINAGAITSPNRDILVSPVVYYYANNQCVASDLFVIPLDKTLSDKDRILRANIIKRIEEPILSTEKNISEKFIFRTMTPIDFSSDGSKLVAKEKIGNINDGIWQTNLWVYDFNTKQSKNLSEIRDAIKFYWKSQEGLALDERRWDIYPLGFDVNSPERIIVSAYGYTGKTPTFLGNWSIDCNGERTLLVSLFESATPVSLNGFKLVKDGVVDPAKLYVDEKMQDKIAKQERKSEKKVNQQVLKTKKKDLHNKLKEMTKEETGVVKQYEKKQGVQSQTSAN
ncbi:MAG: hypothetical protein WCG95_01290 [bacterium]